MAEEDKEIKNKFPVTKVLPRLPVFSGDGKDSDYEQWAYEVHCLVNEKWPEDELKLLIRRSLKGQASRTLMNLGTEATVPQILAKFKAAFGPVLSMNTVMAQFYSLKQGQSEDARGYASRLEDCAHQAVTLGRINQGEVNILLKEAFGSGLRPQTKMATSFLLEDSNLNFDQLVLEVHRRERELNVSSSATSHAVQPSEVADLKAQIATLTSELRNLKMSIPSNQTPVPPTDTGRFIRGASPLMPQQRRHDPSGSFSRARGPRQPITCHRCGQLGHIARGCRNQSIQPPSQHNLNWNQPAGMGHPQVSSLPPSWGRRQ